MKINQLFLQHKMPFECEWVSQQLRARAADQSNAEKVDRTGMRDERILERQWALQSLWKKRNATEVNNSVVWLEYLWHGFCDFIGHNIREA